MNSGRTAADDDEEGAPPPVGDVEICGFHVFDGRLSDAARTLAARARMGHGLWVVTINLQMIAEARIDDGYAALLRRADLFVADGMPLVWLGKMRPHTRLGRVTGVDLVQTLLSTEPALRVGLVGGRQPARLKEVVPGAAARIAHIEDGRIDSEDAGQLAGIVEDLRRTRCQIVLIALGVPKQDALALYFRKHLPGAVIIGVGGSFDMLCGLVPRAPAWMQSVGLEWLFRLAIEPRRLWRRYLLLYPRAGVAIAAWLIHTAMAGLRLRLARGGRLS